MTAQSIDGALDMRSMNQRLAQLETLSACDQIDLGKLERVDSAGASFLLELTRRARRNGHELRFENAPPRLRSLLKFLQIDGILQLTD